MASKPEEVRQIGMAQSILNPLSGPGVIVWSAVVVAAWWAYQLTFGDQLTVGEQHGTGSPQSNTSVEHSSGETVGMPTTEQVSEHEFRNGTCERNPIPPHPHAPEDIAYFEYWGTGAKEYDVVDGKRCVLCKKWYIV